MKEFINIVILVALMATFVLLLLRKIGVIEHVQVHGNEFFSKLANCDFCISWWTCVILVLFVTIYTGDMSCLLVPFFSTPLTRYLL